MEELLQNEIDTRSIDCDASRVVEECMMFEDATKWVESDKFGDVPHQKTGATSLHVAAAKGYIKVIGLLLECNAPINIQDYDGWTPLHAAAHWSQREAIDLLCKNHADMDIKNYVGQTCFDVADPDVLKFLEDLKRKQASMQKDRPDFRNLANRPSTTTTSSLAHSGGRRRSSITRLSIDDKELRLKKDSSYERDSLRGSSLVSETIQESNKSNAESDSDVGRKNRANLSDNNSLPKITLSKDDSSNKVPGYSPPHPAESDKKKPISSSPSESSDDVHPWRRPVSLRSRPVSSTLNSKKDDSSDSEVPLRRIHSFESDEKFYTRLTELREKIRSNHTSSEAASSSSSSNISNPSSTSNEQTPPYRSTTTTTSTNSSSSYRYLNTTPCSSSSSSTTNFSSLPRTYGYHRNLPSLPECSKYSPTNAGSSGSLIRSSSLRDNSVAYTPVPFRQSTQEDESPPSTSQLNTLNNNNIDNNILNDNNNNNQNNSNNFNNHNNNKNNTRLQRRHQNMSTDDDDVSSSKSHTSSSTETPALISDKKINDFTSPHSRPTTLSVGRSLLWKRYEPDGGNRVKSDSSLANNSLSSKHQPPQSHVRRSFVPPVRDEESETQRKAHAKRVRETRRSTQGVTLEDLKSAEQLVKKKQQQENQIRTSELQQLAAAASGGVGSTATTTVTTSATLVTSGGSSPASTPSSTSSAYDRKPSWRLRSSEGANDRNRFRLEDAGPSETLNALRKSSKIEGKGPPPLPSSDPPPLSSPGSKDGGTSVLSSSITTPTGTQKVIQRRKKPKRRSTGVVHLDIGDLDNEEEGDESETEDEMENLSGDAKTSSFCGGASGNNPSSSSNNKYLHPNNAHQPTSGYHNKSMEKDSHNGGDIDYKKLWEESQLDNSRLRDELSKSEDTRGRLEGALHSASKPQMSETEKREKRALEKKLSEMEEELKQIEHLKNEIQRLRDENGALIRVISKLSK
uniref:cGMP-dependent protein kinase interacting domain-containing protein n=1 Tax=Lepeophtheirus salmonis TaxID=72036 RepID=A0A0K2UGN5_LEPSM